MPNWQITAKTIICEAVDDEVTIMVHKDKSVHCTGCKKYTQPNDITRQTIKEKIRKSKQPIKCQGEQCSNVTQYKEKIMAEENG